ATGPLGLHARLERVHALARGRSGELRPLLGRAAGGERRGDEHQLALGLWQPAHELRAVREAGKDDHARDEIPSARARAEADHRRLERAHTWADQIDVRRTSAPA